MLVQADGRWHPRVRELADSPSGTTDITAKVDALPEQAWIPANDGDGRPRDGAWVAEPTGVLTLTG